MLSPKHATGPGPPTQYIAFLPGFLFYATTVAL